MRPPGRCSVPCIIAAPMTEVPSCSGLARPVLVDTWRRLTGMFACAILDVARRRVVLARDPFGIKPLYYVTNGAALAFASEIKTLLALPGVSRGVDAQRLGAYLRFGVTDYGDGTL